MREQLTREYRRLIKEIRPCLAVWLIGVLSYWISVRFFYKFVQGTIFAPEQHGLTFLLIPFFSCFIIGVIPFGHEFTHGTMESLLVRPVKRSRLWYEKMSVLVFLNGSMVLFYYFNFCVPGFSTNAAMLRLIDPIGRFWGVPWLYAWVRYDPGAACIYHFLNFSSSPYPFIFLASIVLGPLFSLYLRQTHLAFWLELVAFPFLCFMSALTESFVHNVQCAQLNYCFEYFKIACFIVLPWMGYWLVRRRFMKLEI